VLRRASVVLASRRSVIVDASFRSRATRERARRLARDLGVRVRFVECRCAADVCRARLARRERERSVSDGRLAIFDELSASFEPMTELAPEEHVAVDTTRPLDVVLAEVRSRCLAA
jgi:predicted kinase